MPIFSYFAVIGPLLMGLLFLADAAYGPPEPLAISTQFAGLPAQYKAPPSIPILTVRESLQPNMEQAASSQAMALASAAPPAPDARKKKVAKVAAQNKAKSFDRQFGRQYGTPGPYAHLYSTPSYGAVR
jgi:hypothetical protein